MFIQSEDVLISFRKTYKSCFSECVLEMEGNRSKNRITYPEEKLIYQLMVRLVQDLDNDFFKGNYKRSTHGMINVSSMGSPLSVLKRLR